MATTWTDLTLALATPSKRYRAKKQSGLLALIVLLFLLPGGNVDARSYLSADEFVGTSFPDLPPVATLWLNEEQKTVAKTILGHPYQGLRIRYWLATNRTAWIIDELGKERPITIGIVVEDGLLKRVEILDYRELRGGEVRHAFFTGQFVGALLTDKHQLSKKIDGISGATLSVNAVKNVGRLALYLHDQVQTL